MMVTKVINEIKSTSRLKIFPETEELSHRTNQINKISLKNKSILCE